ncbi:hypothetical protein ILUMI_16994 [Ignelater luminosus]|uniref:Uncharacterized protein n=1 Tax=Ignelater luminosus TaxID=2038154 RepID=A0A8K0CKP3_IGNLU|nr:hypothetical protein ILUMI_16994 [Ignelater luminosus]
MLNNLRYANDTALIANSEKDRQALLEAVAKDKNKLVRKLSSAVLLLSENKKGISTPKAFDYLKIYQEEAEDEGLEILFRQPTCSSMKLLQIPPPEKMISSLLQLFHQ